MGNKGAFVSAGAQAVSGLLEGNMARRSANIEAKAVERKAKAAYAKGTVDATEARRQARIMESDARAAQAGSGTTTTDAQAISQQADIAAEGEYNALSALFGAKTEEQSLNRAAMMRRYEGKQANTAKMFEGLSTVVSTYIDKR